MNLTPSLFKWPKLNWSLIESTATLLRRVKTYCLAGRPMDGSTTTRNEPVDRQEHCIEPSAGGNVYDYYNGALSPEETTGFERHLIKCYYCERIILELDHALAALNDEQDFEPVLKSDKRLKNTRSPPF